jgi:Tfp pilus assembly protein PilZ
MDELIDRRAFDRLVFSNISATIFRNYWYYSLGHRLFKNLELFAPVKSSVQDISSSGSLIITKSIFKQGQTISLIISIPGSERMIIKGKVLWIAAQTPDMQNVGIQFLAFSNWKKYNSFDVQKQLGLILLKNQ